MICRWWLSLKRTASAPACRRARRRRCRAVDEDVGVRVGEQRLERPEAGDLVEDLLDELLALDAVERYLPERPAGPGSPAARPAAPRRHPSIAFRSIFSISFSVKAGSSAPSFQFGVPPRPGRFRPPDGFASRRDQERARQRPRALPDQSRRPISTTFFPDRVPAGSAGHGAGVRSGGGSQDRPSTSCMIFARRTASASNTRTVPITSMRRIESLLIICMAAADQHLHLTTSTVMLERLVS